MRKIGEKIYCGKDYDEMNKIADTLEEIERTVGLTDEEKNAMDVAIQAVTDLSDIMCGKRRGIIWG